LAVDTVDVNIWRWDAIVLLGLAAWIGAYAIGVRAMYRRRSPEIHNRHIALFACGVLCLFLALESPIDIIGEKYLFSIHMVQHILLQMIAPALILLGLPRWMMQRVLALFGLEKPVRLITHPLLAFIAFNLALIAWHVPALYEAALRDPMIHILEHGIFIGTGFLSWYPVIDPARQHHSFAPIAKIVYLFLYVIPSGILGAIFAFAQAPLYPYYAGVATRLWELSVLDDQALAGAIMWVPGWAIYFIALSIVFAVWMNREDAEAKQLSR
jgi:putative membrane protein